MGLAMKALAGQQDFFELEGLGQSARNFVKDAQMIHLLAFDHSELAFFCQDEPHDQQNTDR